MKYVLAQRIAIAVLMSAVVLGTAYAQEHDHAAVTATAAKPAAKPAAAARPAAPATEPQEVFCGTMKTGQLCSHGTSTLLGLSADKSVAWLAAVRQYNSAVNAAITALQAQAKTNLSPEQVAEVNRWFAIGINPQINQLLASSDKQTGGR